MTYLSDIRGANLWANFQDWNAESPCLLKELSNVGTETGKQIGHTHDDDDMPVMNV